MDDYKRLSHSAWDHTTRSRIMSEYREGLEPASATYLGESRKILPFPE